MIEDSIHTIHYLVLTNPTKNPAATNRNSKCVKQTMKASYVNISGTTSDLYSSVIAQLTALTTSLLQQLNIDIRTL